MIIAQSFLTRYLRETYSSATLVYPQIVSSMSRNEKMHHRKALFVLWYQLPNKSKYQEKYTYILLFILLN